MINYAVNSFGPEFGFTNSYIIGPTDKRQALIVDPGRGSAPWIHDTLGNRDLTAVAILLTHGHMDHTWDAAPLADDLGIPVYLPRAGHHLLTRPEAGLPTQFPRHLLEEHPHRSPVLLRTPARTMHVAGLNVTTVPTPGHTPCSVTYVLTQGPTTIACTGDTLLGNGAIGTPVPPGGNADHLMESARALFANWIDRTCTVLPGHGEPYQISVP